jgi:peroxiredoxin family protein
MPTTVCEQPNEEICHEQTLGAGRRYRRNDDREQAPPELGCSGMEHHDCRSGRRTSVVPQFDDEAGGRKLAIICSKGTLDMAYPGLVLANAALGEGIETHLFFTFWGFEMINKKTTGTLQFTLLGNPATHMPHGLGGLPWMTAMATSKMKKSIADVGVPEVPEFLELIVASGRGASLGMPNVGRHESPHQGGPLRRGRGRHQCVGLHRENGRGPTVVHLSAAGTLVGANGTAPSPVDRSKAAELID